MVDLRVLGEVSVWADGRLVPLGARKHYGLLVLLGLEQGRVVRRDYLISMLWERSGRAAARQSLRQAIYAIRTRLPQLPLEATRDELWLPEGSLEVDALRFRAAALEARWADAIALYAGPFMSGFWLSDARAFQEWQESTEKKLEAFAYRAIQETLKSAETRGDWPMVEALATRLIEMDYFDEAAHRARLSAIASRGEVRQAQQELEQLESTVRAQLGRGLEPETAELLEAFRQENSDGAGRPDPHGEEEVLTPFHGRDEEFQAVRQAWLAMRSGEGQTVVILGEAGIGKTRFCRHFLRYAAVHGSRILQGRCFPSETKLPYTGLTDAMLEGLRESDLTDLPPVWSEVILELLPELARPDQRPVSIRMLGEGSSRRVFEAVAQLLQTIAAKRDIVLLIDDFQWADASTVALLHYLNRRLTSSRVLILLSLRPEDAPASSAVKHLVAPLARIGRISTIRLGTLPEGPTAAIVDSFITREGLRLAPAMRKALLERVGGHPFFLLEMLKAIRDGEISALDTSGGSRRTGSGAALPVSVSAFLAARFETLSTAALEMMRSLAVLGREATLELVRTITGQTLPVAIEGLEELVTRGLVEESGPTVRFVHDLVREAAYAFMTGFRRRNLHARSAAALHQSGQGHPGQIAWHYDLAGKRAEAFHFALLAAEESERVYAHAETENFLRMALANASSPKERTVCESRLAALMYRLRRFDDAQALFARVEAHQADAADQELLLPMEVSRLLVRAKRGGVAAAELVERLESLAKVAETAGLHEQAGVILRSLAEAAHDAGRRDIVATVIPKLLALGHAADAGSAGVAALAMAGTMIGLYESVNAGLECAEKAVAKAERTGAPGDRVMALLSRAGNLIQAGRLSDAGADLDLALDIAEKRALVEFRYSILNNIGALYGEMGVFDRAEAALAEAARFVTEYDGAHDLLFLYANLSLIKLDMGELDGAAEAAKAVLACNETVCAWWAGANALAILGLHALERGQLAEANRCRREILALFEGRDFWVGDFSYAEMFLARLAAVEGEEEKGLVRLDRAVAAYEGRDAMCWSRLQLERARLLLSLDRAEARRTARRVRARAARAGARPLVAKAEAILDRVMVKD